MEIGAHFPSPEAVACRVFRKLSEPAVQLVAQSRPARSHFGGLPEVPPGFVWPRNGHQPLSYLGRIDLTQLRSTREFPWLPASGDLLFFYDAHHQPEGREPSDYTGWRVIYQPSDFVNLRSTRPLRRLGTQPARVFPRLHLRPREIATVPNWENPKFPLDLRDPATNVFSEKLRPQPYRNEPRHQVGGYCDPIQTPEMALQCALVSRGLSLRGIEPHIIDCDKPLRQEAEGWRLLLQVDSDERLRMNWGNAGMLYFWIREADARALRFDRTWMLLQDCE